MEEKITTDELIKRGFVLQESIHHFPFYRLMYYNKTKDVKFIVEVESRLHYYCISIYDENNNIKMMCEELINLQKLDNILKILNKEGNLHRLMNGDYLGAIGFERIGFGYMWEGLFGRSLRLISDSFNSYKYILSNKFGMEEKGRVNSTIEDFEKFLTDHDITLDMIKYDN